MREKSEIVNKRQILLQSDRNDVTDTCSKQTVALAARCHVLTPLNLEVPLGNPLPWGNCNVLRRRCRRNGNPLERQFIRLQWKRH